MIIQVSVKQIGSRRKIKTVPFHLDGTPHTVSELIRMSVHTCVYEYNQRFLAKEKDVQPLSADEITEMSEIGKIAFGINYGEKQADEKKAVADAFQAYEDGLFRIFIGDNEAGGINDGIDISENESISFIRLTMLAGRLW